MTPRPPLFVPYPGDPHNGHPTAPATVVACRLEVDRRTLRDVSFSLIHRLPPGQGTAFVLFAGRWGELYGVWLDGLTLELVDVLCHFLWWAK